MKVGLFAPLGNPFSTPEYITTLGREADERGFHSIWVAEHVVLFDEYDEDWSRLGWVMLHGRATVGNDDGDYWRALGALTARYPQYRGMALEGNPMIRIDCQTVRHWGHLDEELVARDVAERVVDYHEPVEVAEEDGEAARGAALGARDGELDVVGEERAVRQTRQRVVEGVVAQALLGLLALGDVLEL